MLERQRDVAAAFGNQPAEIVERARTPEEARKADRTTRHVQEAVTYAGDRHIEREATVGEHELMRAGQLLLAFREPIVMQFVRDGGAVTGFDLFAGFADGVRKIRFVKRIRWRTRTLSADLPHRNVVCSKLITTRPRHGETLAISCRMPP